MINDFKLGFKIIKYGLNLKASIILSVFFLIIGIFMDIVVSGSVINGMYYGMGGIMVVQLVYSVSVSAMVQSSSRKRQLQTSVPAILCGGVLLLGNTISLAAKFIGLKFLEFDLKIVANGILFNALLVIIIVLYIGGAMKAFWQATVCFTISYVIFFCLSMTLQFWEGEIPQILPMEAAIAVSYIMIMGATFLMYGLFVAMYKRDISKRNFETLLRRAK